jgi:YD repeat-containing protein
VGYKLRSLSLTVLILLLAAAVGAQVQTGTPPFGSFGGGPDVINLANLNVQIAIPIVAKAGRGVPFSYTLSYDSSAWYPVTSGSTHLWQYVPNFGWRGVTEVTTGYVTYDSFQSGCYGDDGKLHTYTVRDNYAYHDPFGLTHSFENLMIRVGADPWGCSGLSTSGSDTAVDGSGYAITAGGSTVTVNSISGRVIHPPVNSTSGAGSYSDSNGNQISVNASGVFTDTLGTTALTVSGSAPTVTFAYTPPAGGSASYTMKYTGYTVQTNFGCSGISEYGPSSISLVSEIDLPDGSKYTFSYETTPGHSPNVTGRVASVTLPTGGTISYTYTGGSNGITCADGSAAGLTRATPDGTWTYARTAGTTTITDPTTPTGNQTVIQFQSIYETQRQVYQGSSASGTLLETIQTCYNGSATPCTGTAVGLPITQRTVTIQFPSSGLQCKHNYLYNSFGLPTEVDDYDYGSGGPGSLIRKALISYASLGNGIVDRVSQVTLQDGSANVKAQTNINYDETSVSTTTSTPQHVSVSGSRGNPTTVKVLVAGTTTLNRTFTYYDTGTVNTATDVNNAVTTYNYSSTGSCGNSFVTSVTPPISSLATSQTWNCTGAVVTQATDANSNSSTASYTDAYFWRPASTTDPASAVTSFTFPSSSPFNTLESSLPFNSGNSVVDQLVTVDGLGRPHVQQRKQGPSATNYDSVETDYDPLGRPSVVSMPYSAAAGQTSSSAPKTTTTYDALSRSLLVTDGEVVPGTVSYSYTQNDVLVTVGPAPTGENTKQRQLEYDSIGRLTSACEITSGTGSGSCAQTSAKTGYWTKYVYDAAGRLTGVTQNAQASSGQQQTRSYSFDLLGRMTSETNAESGTTSYVFDTDATCGTYSGDLVKRTDAVGNATCYAYDTLHRVTSGRCPEFC